MIKHVVMWKLKEEAEGAIKTENIRKMVRVLEALREQIPGIRNLEVGVDSCELPGTSDVVLIAEFDDFAALRNYIDHPAHQKAGEFVGKVRAERAAVDYEC